MPTNGKPAGSFVDRVRKFALRYEPMFVQHADMMRDLERDFNRRRRRHPEETDDLPPKGMYAISARQLCWLVYFDALVFKENRIPEATPELNEKLTLAIGVLNQLIRDNAQAGGIASKERDYHDMKAIGKHTQRLIRARDTLKGFRKEIALANGRNGQSGHDDDSPSEGMEL